MRAILLIVFLLFEIVLEGGNHGLWSDRIFKSYQRQLLKEKGWIVTVKGYNYRHKTPKNSYIFTGQQCLTLEEARRCYVEETQRLIKYFNSSKKINNQLNFEPFTIEDMEYAVAFEDSSSQYYAPPYIAFVYSIRGNVLYDIYNPDTGQLERLHKESYEEAVRIVQEENQHGYDDF